METQLQSSPGSDVTALPEKYNILYVDDEETNLRIFKYAFQKDYNVFLAVGGNEAMELIEENEIHLIITDQRMPAMTGVDLLRKVVPKHPQVIRMIMTGFSDVGVLIDAVNDIGINKYLKKPWDRNDLKSTLDSELERSFGISEIQINPDGVIVEQDEVQQTLQFTQSTFLKSQEQIEQIFPRSVFLTQYTEGISSDIHWVVETSFGQKVAILLNTRMCGSQAGLLTSALHSMISETMLYHHKINPSVLLEHISDELTQRGFTNYFKQHESDGVGVCVLAVDEASNSIEYASNYRGIKFSNTKNEIIDGDLMGTLKIDELNRAFVFTESFNSSCTDHLVFSQLINESIEMEFEEQSKFLTDEISGPGAFAGLCNITLLGIEFNCH